MKGLLLVFLVLSCSCNKDALPLPSDYCPTCSSMIEVNDTVWPSKPVYAWFQILASIDTFFILEISESNPTHDTFNDALLFWRLPYEVGEYPLDSTLYSTWKTDVSFHVFEVEYGTAAEIYGPVYDGSSLIRIDSLDKTTGEFSISFNLILFPHGNPDAEIHNYSYPAIIRFNGQADGIVTYE